MMVLRIPVRIYIDVKLYEIDCNSGGNYFGYQ